MKIAERDERPITKDELDQIERYADKLFAKVDVDVEFTRHFLQRVNDERNRKQITPSELIRLFKQTYQRYGKKIPALGADAQAVIQDMKTDINMPFVLEPDGHGGLDLISKTIMRKRGFRTSNPTLTIEQIHSTLNRIDESLTKLVEW